MLAPQIDRPLRHAELDILLGYLAIFSRTCICWFDNVAIVPGKCSWFVEDSVILLASLDTMTVARSFMIIWLHAMAISCGKLNIWFPYQTIGMNHYTSSNDLMFRFQCWNSKTRIFLRVLATYQLYVVLLLLSSCYSSPSSFLNHF